MRLTATSLVVLLGSCLTLASAPLAFSEVRCRTDQISTKGYAVQKVVCQKSDGKSMGTPASVRSSQASRARLGIKQRARVKSARESPFRVQKISYCQHGQIHHFFPDAGLTMTAGIACDSSTPSPSSRPTTPAITEHEAAQVAVNQLDVSVPTLRLGPDWRANEWNMLAVGYPMWVWADETSSIRTSRTIAGMTIALSAPKPTLVVDYGDGTRQRCSTTTPYSWEAWQKAPNHESPTCGHTYTRKGEYSVTLTATWQVSWSGPGHSGVIPITLTSPATTVPVGELESVLVPVPK